MSQLSKWLEQGPLLTDGAWGTQLHLKGLEPGACPDVWNITNPEAVAEVARSYVEAGSQVILTNTFRSNSISLPEEWAGRAAEINAAGVRISKEAAVGRALVFASMGPSGKMVFSGEISERELRTAFEAQARALAAAGANALVIETQSDLDEAEIILRSARGTELPLVVSFTFDSGREHDKTLTGASAESVARNMQAAGADVIGANCGSGVERYLSLTERLHAACDLPVWIKPNAGLPIMRDGELYYRQSPQDFATFAPALISAGASFIGACCGSTPQFVRALKAVMAA